MQAKSNAEAVREFTEGASGIPCPVCPSELAYGEVQFIIRMVMSEMCELAATVTKNNDECDSLMNLCLDTTDKSHLNFKYENNFSRIGAQADAMVDAWYYMLDTAAKHGINLSTVFDVVHEANMNKRDPVSGKFLRRESDGKVIK